MSNERERLAREWAEKYLRYADESDSEELYGAAQIVKANTTPPTMDEVEWNDEKHFLAGAVYEVEGSTCPVVMVGETRDGCEIYSVDLDENTGFWPMHGDLTPNGKKYELHEMGETVSSNEKVGPDQKEHPETLRTAEDYKDAPVGTIVAHNGCFPYVKKGRDVWTDTFDDKFSDDLLSGISRQVLRWGWGE